MKTLVVVAFLAALAAFLVLPLDFETTLSALFAAGLATLAVADYCRRVPLLRRAAPTPVGVASRWERLGLAA